MSEIFRVLIASLCLTVWLFMRDYLPTTIGMPIWNAVTVIIAIAFLGWIFKDFGKGNWG
jgi:hypothetical protein